jgi:hypothetical protein
MRVFSRTVSGIGSPCGVWLVALTCIAVSVVHSSCSRPPSRERFDSPEKAAAALMQALERNDQAALRSIFGKDVVTELASGDPISDRHDREAIALAMRQSFRWAPQGENSRELIIGDEQWPFPAPLLRRNGEWEFDTETGEHEVLARRIGRNEISVIQLCQSFINAQHQYARLSHDGNPPGIFAARLRSRPGAQDGLYWPVPPGQPPSPLGDLVAEAEVEGYDRGKAESIPFWGYHFKVLTRQGSNANGGARDFMQGGRLAGGFALVAYPAKYRYSGVMSFVVSHEGIVYEKDLGTDTVSAAARISEFNPDQSWTPLTTQ